MKPILALLVALSAAATAQDAAKKKPPARKKTELQQSAHTAPTPEQLRRFRQLEEKEKQQKK